MIDGPGYVQPTRRVRPSLAALTAALLLLTCATDPAAEPGGPRSTTVTQTSDRSDQRDRMVERQIRARGVRDTRVLEALRAVPRHRFVPDGRQIRAYADTALPIGFDQTVSQPYIVAYMTEALQLPANAKVLEVGTGSGYQAAILAEIASEVYTVEIVPKLAVRSQQLLTELGYDNVITRLGDGYRGWPTAAPFDGIIVTAAPDHVPPALVEQLGVGARLVIPVGRFAQELTIVTKTADGSTSRTTIPVRFVPMTGEALKQ